MAQAPQGCLALDALKEPSVFCIIIFGLTANLGRFCRPQRLCENPPPKKHVSGFQLPTCGLLREVRGRGRVRVRVPHVRLPASVLPHRRLPLPMATRNQVAHFYPTSDSWWSEQYTVPELHKRDAPYERVCIAATRALAVRAAHCGQVTSTTQLPFN